MPNYFKSLIELYQNRNGLLIKTQYRKSKYGDKISYNILQEIWNKIKIEDRNIQDKETFNNKMQTNKENNNQESRSNKE